ncbi:LysR family transcriptional regulator [Enterococcus sp. LJL120]
MNYRQCEIFRAVARQENFTKAAKQLFMTQSAVSHAMGDLEKEANTQLLERLHRGVRLTPAGEIFLQEILPILENFERVENHLPQLAQQLPLRIGSCMTYAKSDLPSLIQQLQQEKIRCKVTVGPAGEIAQLLEQGQIDIAFLEGQRTLEGYQQKPLASYPIGFYANQDFIDRHKVKFSFAEVLQQPLLLRERGSAVREALEASVTLRNFQLRPAWESNDSEALIEAALHGVGIAVLPEVLIAAELAAGTLIPLQIPQVKLENPVAAAIRSSTEIPQILNLWQQL